METNKDILDLLKTNKYDFLRYNQFLGNNIALLALSGSRAYGTNIPTSDIDIRGFALNSTKEIFNIEPDFQQVEDVNTDTTIYSLNKIIKLLIGCNPTTIEILGCRPEDYLYCNEYGQRVLDTKESFLSIRAVDTFGGYINQQYNRLQHGLIGNGSNDDRKLEMLRHSLNNALRAFNENHRNSGIAIELKRISTEELLELYPERKITNENSNEHIVVNGNLDNVCITDFKTIISELHKIQSEYNNINKKNTKKTDEKLTKHMMHLVRPYLMGIDLNTSGIIKTYRDGEEHEMLMDIRMGKYVSADGLKVKSDFYDLVSTIQDKYNYAVKYTILPEAPNFDAINNMFIDIYRNKFTA